ncbi:AIR synthase related protein [Microbacterium lacus]|uniref:AIR synthase related protein n=1 Tax=Microbacterium lacus TaxID=415217 RepID=UPI0031D2C69A
MSEILSGLVGPQSWSGLGLTVTRLRDLVIVDLGSRSLVIACDSNASIGDLPADHLKQDPRITGYSVAKVPLMEVLAVGATPFLIVDNLCCDLLVTGVRILQGIKDIVDEAGLEVMITGSDESNMPTRQTGVGITVMGVLDTAALRVGTARPGDELWVVGRRRSGIGVDAYAERDGSTASAVHVAAATRLPGVHEVLPVGSHGIRFEALELARTANAGVQLRDDVDTDLGASAGASTCFLVACDPERADGLRSLALPLELVGSVRSTEE